MTKIELSAQDYVYLLSIKKAYKKAMVRIVGIRYGLENDIIITDKIIDCEYIDIEASTMCKDAFNIVIHQRLNSKIGTDAGLAKWVETNDLIIVKDDNRAKKAIIPYDKYVELLRYEQAMKQGLIVLDLYSEVYGGGLAFRGTRFLTKDEFIQAIQKHKDVEMQYEYQKPIMPQKKKKLFNIFC